MRTHLENIKNRVNMRQIKKHHLTLMIRLYALLEHGFTLVEAMNFLYGQLNIKNALRMEDVMEGMLFGFFLWVYICFGSRIIAWK